MSPVNVDVYNVLLPALREDLTKQVLKFRLPIEQERTHAAFLMYKKTLHVSKLLRRWELVQAQCYVLLNKSHV